MKFKVGDWVRHKRLRTTHRCTYVNGGEFDNKISTIPSLSFDSEYMCDYELWQPKEGEWCWFFTDKMKLDNIGILRRFTQMEKDIEDNDMFGCEPTVSDKEEFESIKVFYKYCEPFIGQLPSFIKENK